MLATEQLSDFDMFFYYGEGDVLDEIQTDMYIGIMNPKRSLFYDRQDSCGIPERENMPQSFVLQVGMKYDIIKWIGYRNANVETGENGGKERRVASSQTAITVEMATGKTDVSVFYIPIINIQATNKVTVPILQTRGL